MMVDILDAKGVVQNEFVSPWETVNTACYAGVLKSLRKKVLRVWKEITATWVPRHDNALSHTVLRVREFMEKHS